MSKLIDNYIIISTIGSSDWCEEHKGRNLLTKELVFIRTVRVDRFYSDTILKERILNEINVLKRIHSESVVKMLKMLKSNNHLYLIYEYVSEGIDKYPYGCLQFLRCFLQVWRDIARCGVTHGSLRPSAIRFQDKVIKIKNFECAHIDNGQFISPKYYAYSAPEVLNGQCNNKSDVYSLGMIAYKMIYGRLPYNEDISLSELIGFWSHTNHIELKSQTIDNQIMCILSAMLQKDPKARCNWQQLWRMLNTSESIGLSRDYPLARSVEDCSPQKGSKKQFSSEQRSVNDDDTESKLTRLTLQYGQRRNKVSLLVACLKQLASISQPNEDLKKIISSHIILLKRYSSQLKQFAQRPSKYLNWLDPQTQQSWCQSDIYEVSILDHFERLPSSPKNEMTEAQLLVELKTLDTPDNTRRRIKYCIKLLEDLNLINRGLMILQPTRNLYDSQRCAIGSHSSKQVL